MRIVLWSGRELALTFCQPTTTTRPPPHQTFADARLVNEISAKENPKGVCHMAARAGVRPSIDDPYVYIHSNIEGATRLMEISARYDVGNFVFASSSSVYGGSKSTLFSEDEVVDRPVSPYAASKKICELLAYTYHHLYKLNVTGLRFFTVYGPRGRPDMAPFKFIQKVSNGAILQQFGVLEGTSHVRPKTRAMYVKLNSIMIPTNPDPR